MRSTPRSPLPAATLLAALLAAPGSLQAQAGTVVTPGSVVSHISSASDTTQAYALYVPAAYDASRPWPLLLMMDPDGRAVPALEPFVAAAEQHGWLVMSASGDGDGFSAVQGARAMNAMIADATRTFHVDERRLYLAGFSSTVRMVWQFASQLGSAVAGVYTAGADGGPITRVLPVREGLAVFGAAGEGDFAYEAVRDLGSWLDERDQPHRIRVFDGAHRWPPADVAGEALRWFEFQASLAGLRTRDPALREAVLEADLDAAADLEREGRPADALRRYEEIAAEFEGLPGAAGARRAVDRLSADPDVQAVLERRHYQSLVFDDYTSRVEGWVLDLREAREPTSPASGVRLLDIEPLKERAARTGDHDDAAAARRQLEWARLRLGHHEPRVFLSSNEPERALVVLDVAASIGPEDADALLLRAQATVALGRDQEAIGLLERAVADGASLRRIRQDPAFSELRDDPRFRALVAARGEPTG